MTGSEIMPIATTDAPTTPVAAARSVPTNTTASARPPRSGPNRSPIVRQEVLRQLGLLEHRPHEDEEGHGEQDVVRHHAEHALGEGVEQRPLEVVLLATPTKAKISAVPPSEKATGIPREDQQRTPRPRTSAVRASRRIQTRSTPASFATGVLRLVQADRLTVVSRAAAATRLIASEIPWTSARSSERDQDHDRLDRPAREPARIRRLLRARLERVRAPYGHPDPQRERAERDQEQRRFPTRSIQALPRVPRAARTGRPRARAEFVPQRRRAPRAGTRG